MAWSLSKYVSVCKTLKYCNWWKSNVLWNSVWHCMNEQSALNGQNNPLFSHPLVWSHWLLPSGCLSPQSHGVRRPVLSKFPQSWVMGSFGSSVGVTGFVVHCTQLNMYDHIFPQWGSFFLKSEAKESWCAFVLIPLQIQIMGIWFWTMQCYSSSFPYVLDITNNFQPN